ncbi:MAG: hypothetical protein EOP07_18640 [Proteobacteria bacterium]|nr:MAG: hypothetical protein EOP07_18640 [Pseudomonadota bacterium]
MITNLVPTGIFSDLTTVATQEWISAPAGAGIMKIEAWYLVGFRYDPCAPSNDLKDRSCIRELRLIAQPKTQFGPADSALHLVYKLGEGMPGYSDGVLKDLVNLKRQGEAQLGITTGGLPLNVHPLLSKAVSVKNTNVPELFKAFVLKYANANKLHKLTMMGLRDGSPLDWLFIGGNIEKGRWVQTSVPNISKGVPNSFVELNLGGNFEVFTPVTETKTLSTEDFFNTNPQGVESKMDILNEAVHRLENPALSNRNTADCVSCHTATTIRIERNFKFLPSMPGLTAKVPDRITAFPAPQMLQNHPTHWNLRALGYFGILATISMRTVNESAHVAEMVNDVLGFEGPGRDCSAVQEAVMACFVNSSRLFGTVTPTEECLKTCKL